MSFTDTPDFSMPKGDGDSAIPVFSIQPVQNAAKTTAAGHPVFDDVEFVEILLPGDRKTGWYGRVSDAHRERFARQYTAWKSKQEEPLEGMPIGELPGITRSQAEELKFANVKTVEALASLPDNALNTTVAMGGFALRERAQRYLAKSKDDAPAEKLAAENAAKDATIKQMQEAMAAMQAQMEQMQQAMANANVSTPSGGQP